MDFGICQKITSYITRPPRTRYQIDDLGPQKFNIRNHEYERIDFTVINQRQQKIESSLFRQVFNQSCQNTQKQTVIFLHANSSSRLAAKNYLPDLLPFFNVVCFDCSGSGNSEGEVVTLGYYEKQDLRALINILKQKYGLNEFFLWGRSMGSVTALLYAAKYGDLLGVVSDNAFSDLQLTCKQLKNSYFPIMPDFLLDTLLEQTQQHIDTNINKPQKINFSIMKLKPLKIVKKIACPIFYIYSENDRIVPNYHTMRLYDQSNYPKRIMGVKGDHNGIRDFDIKGKVVDYLLGIVVERKKKHKLLESNGFGDIKERMLLSEYNKIKQKSNSNQNHSNFQYESPFDEFLCKSYQNRKNSQSPENNKNPVQPRFSQTLTKSVNWSQEKYSMNFKGSTMFESDILKMPMNGMDQQKRKLKRRKIFQNNL